MSLPCDSPRHSDDTPRQGTPNGLLAGQPVLLSIQLAEGPEDVKIQYQNDEYDAK